MNWLNGLFKNQKGVFLVFTAVLLPIIFACAGLAMDLGNAFAHKSKLQNAADAAVLVYGKIDYGNNKEPETAEQYMKANGEANKMYKITERPLTGTGDANSVLLSLYASEDVPTTFMRMFGFDKVPVSVVATCKVQKKSNKSSGVFKYAFIGANTKDATQSLNGEETPSIYLHGGFYHIEGKVHTNGAIRLDGNVSGRDGQRLVFVDPGKFSTSMPDDEHLWYWSQAWPGEEPKELHTNDIPDPNNPGLFKNFRRFGYYDGTKWGQDVLAANTYQPNMDVSLNQQNSETAAIYDYVENLRKQHVDDPNDKNQMKTDTYVKTDGNYSSTKEYEKWDGWGTYRVVISDGDIDLSNANQIDFNAKNVVLISLHGNVIVRTGKNIKALVYAPNGNFYFNGPTSGEAVFEGSVVAKGIYCDTHNLTFKWNDFDFPNDDGSSGNSGSSSGGSISSGSAGTIGKVTLHADQDSNYGNESTLWGS